MQRKEPRKKKLPAEVLFGYYFKRYFNHNMAGQKSPKRARRNLSSNVDFWRAIFLGGVLGCFSRGIMRGWAPQALASQEAQQRKLSCCRIPCFYPAGPPRCRPRSPFFTQRVWVGNGPGQFLGSYVINRVFTTRWQCGWGWTLTLSLCLSQLLLVL